MRSRFVLLLFVMLVGIAAGVYGAMFVDNSESDFDAGTYSDTFYNTSISAVQLNISQGSSTGQFTSQIFDATAEASWHNISWTSGVCYGCELPGNEAVESGDFVNPADMGNNVLLLHLNESSGTLQDSSGNDNDGADRGGITYDARGKFDTAIEFDGNNDRIRVLDDNTLDITGDITIAYWSYAHDFNGDPDVITKGAFNQAYSIWYWQADGRVAFALNNDRLTSNRQLSANAWYHIVAVRDGSTRRIYINGVEDASDTYGTAIGTNTANLFLSTNSFPFDGVLDEVSIYDRALGADEIGAQYLRGAARLNLSVRSCDDAACSGESFTAVSGNSPQSLSVANNTYFQYRFDFETENLNFSSELYNVSIDYSISSAPVAVNVVYPQNITYGIVQTVLNYTVEGNAVSCWYTLNGGVTNTSATCGTNVTGLDSGQGSSTWTVYANDSAGNVNSSSMTFFVDSIVPEIAIVNPANGSLFTTSNVGVNYTVFDAGGLDSCWYSLNGGVNTSVSCGVNFTVSGSDGANEVVVYVNDTLNNVNTSSVLFTIDSMPPLVGITEPLNITYGVVQTALGYTVSDASLDSCWYTLNGGVTNTSVTCGTNVTGLDSGQGSSTWTVYANDTFGLTNESSVTFFVDSVAPAVAIITPLNNSVFSDSDIAINYTVFDVGVGLDRCWYTVNAGVTNMTLVCGTNFSITAQEGSNEIVLYANDTLGAVNASTVSFSVDSTPPQVFIIDPDNGQTFGFNESLSLNYSVLDAGVGLDSCWYSLNGGVNNVSVSSCANTTFDVAGDGSYTVFVYANDTLNNLGSDSADFSVQLGAPTISLISPVDVYLNYTENIEFVYEVFDVDLTFCELWGDFNGTYARNQTNPAFVPGQDSFFLNLSSDGNYTWSVYCEDLILNGAFTGNETFGIDTVAPVISLTEPSGTYSSVSNIPLTYSVDDTSPFECSYNVSFASTGNSVIDTKAIKDCNDILFDVDIESSYVLYLTVNDSAGHVNHTNTSFTISAGSGSGSGGDGGGSGGGSGGGGGGGGSGGISGLAGTTRLALSELAPLRMDRGTSEIVSMQVSNQGSRFLNRCKLVGIGVFENWISNRQVESLSSGQDSEFIFSVNVPLDAAPDTYAGNVTVACNETSASTPLSIEVLAGDFDMFILSSERTGGDLRVSYALENFASIDQDIVLEYTLVNENEVVFAQGEESVFLPGDSREEFSFSFELPKNSVGEFTLVLVASNGAYSNRAEQELLLSDSGLTGFVISDDNRRTLSIFFFVVLIAVGFYFSLKFLRTHHRRVRIHEKPGRHFIKIDLKE